MPPGVADLEKQPVRARSDATLMIEIQRVFVPTWSDFVYVAFVIAVCSPGASPGSGFAGSRTGFGWRASHSAHMNSVLDALEQVLHGRRPVQGSGLVHHSHRG